MSIACHGLSNCKTYQELVREISKLQEKCTKFEEAQAFQLCEHCECRKNHRPNCQCTNDE